MSGRTGVVTLAVGLVASGCYSGGFWSDTSTYRFAQSHPVDDTKEVARRAELGFSGNVAELRVLHHDTCARALDGTGYELQQTRRDDQNFWPVGAGMALTGGGLLGAIVGLGNHDSGFTQDSLVAAAVGGIILVSWAVMSSHKTSERWDARAVTHVALDAPLHPCFPGEHTEPVRGAVLRATFADGSTIAYVGHIDPDGVDRLDLHEINAVASWCGPATIRAEDVAGIDASAITGGITETASAVTPLAEIPAGESRDTATRCAANRRSACLRALPAESVQMLRLGCEEGCAAAVDAAGPLLDKRDCDAASQDAGDHQVCDEEYRRALGEAGVTPSDLFGCVNRCVDGGRQLQCK